MMLSGHEIERRLGKEISITPYNPKQLNPNSYNLTLHNELLMYTKLPLRMDHPNPTTKITIPEEGILLVPGRLYLGRTVERISTPIREDEKSLTVPTNLVSFIDGRSSLGRLGINIHATAGYGDLGFDGYYTAEISCVEPVILLPGIEFCQIYFLEVCGMASAYDGKYNRNDGIQASMLYKDFEK